MHLKTGLSGLGFTYRKPRSDDLPALRHVREGLLRVKTLVLFQKFHDVLLNCYVNAYMLKTAIYLALANATAASANAAAVTTFERLYHLLLACRP